MAQHIGIGLAGFGTVGSGVFEYLQHQRDLLAERTGSLFEVHSIVLRDPSKKRDITAPASLLTSSWRDLLKDSRIKIVVELMGGTTDALDLIKESIRSGRIVVTANKALLAEHGQEVFALAQQHGVPIFYEAAVAGGIPIIQSLRDAFVGNRIESIHGILNGTTNYILSRMQEAALDYPEALAEAVAMGYAEADPTLDINGWDAGHKAIILAALAYGFWVPPQAIRVEGIQQVTLADIRFAESFGYTIKLLATIQATSEGVIELFIGPTLIPKSTVLASVNGVFNAIALKGDLVGDALFYGRGAGQKPTASSVIGDLVEAALSLESPRRTVGFSSHALYGKYRAINEVVSSYYLRLSVEDRPGVLAKVASILGEAGIGIASVVQPESTTGDETDLVLMLHQSAYGAVRSALDQMKLLSCIRGEPVLFNIATV
ncbi:MAG: homoserine dehydrogenase [Chthoniobacterales bacterium]|nr:homoserine dehydrogenase [Chthoniobacterales bacterium]